MSNEWLGTRATSYSNLITYYDSNPQKMRDGISKNILPNGGWHFSYLLDPEGIALKIKSFAHSEYDSERYTNPEVIKKKIQNGEDLFSNQNKITYIKIDNCYPDYLLGNLEKYSKFIRGV
jgi:beta-1,4-mannosyl-glycoprotein beta-1,4-N-acetylglucosaminyltransferase